MVNSGRLRHIINIQKSAVTRDAFGAETITWSDFTSSIRADVQPLSMREFFQAQQVGSELTHKVTMRYSTGIEPAMRVLYDSKQYDIKSIIDEDERHKKITLLCSRVAT